MSSRGWVILIPILLILLGSLVVPALLELPPPKAGAAPVLLELTVNPNGIPTSGSWTIESALFDATNDTRFVVPASITLTATLTDGSKTVQKLNATNGTATFYVPLGTVAATFAGQYAEYRATTVVSTQKVVPQTTGITQAGQGITAGFTLAVAAWIARGAKNSTGSRVAFALPGFLLGLVPLAYLAQNYSSWYGTGWFPSDWYGIPIFGIAVASYVGSGVSAGISKATANDGRDDSAQGGSKVQ